MDALEQMGRGDIGHVEGRILAQQHHVHGRKVDPFRFAQREVVALLVAQFHRLYGGDDAAVAHGKPVGRIMEKLVAAGLGFQAHRKGRIPRDRDAGDMVHLDRNIGDIRHGRPLVESHRDLGRLLEKGNVDDHQFS